MKIIKALSIFTACLFLSGCITLRLPGVQPLAEKVIGGSGADKIVVVDVSGIITDDAPSGLLGIQTRANITARIREELNMAAGDPLVKGVILRINTPGGAVTTCDIINHEISAFKKKKGVFVVAELMDLAASGGYYVAVAADKIIAHPTTVTGSIGVIAYNLNASGLMEKIGIADQTIKSGDKKDIGSPLRQMTADERTILQSVISGLYERFLDVIIEGRKGAFSRDELRRIADGRIYTAAQALELKLIDSIGYMDDAVESAKKAAGLKEATIITYASEGAYKNNYYSSAFESGGAAIGLVNVDTSFLKSKFGFSFMYVWM